MNTNMNAKRFVLALALASVASTAWAIEDFGPGYTATTDSRYDGKGNDSQWGTDAGGRSVAIDRELQAAMKVAGRATTQRTAAIRAHARGEIPFHQVERAFALEAAAYARLSRAEGAAYRYMRGEIERAGERYDSLTPQQRDSMNRTGGCCHNTRSPADRDRGN